MLKMLCHMTLLFDEKNFERRFNPINGGSLTVNVDFKRYRCERCRRGHQNSSQALWSGIENIS